MPEGRHGLRMPGMVILGIDPGLSGTGFGAVRFDKTTPSLLTCGHIKTSPRQHIASRLFHIHADISEVIRTVSPDIVAVEKAFSLVRYPKAGIILGGVLGIIYLSVFQHEVALMEITPREVKNSLVGYGGADKRQIRDAIKSLLRLTRVTSYHASDALAIALAAFYRRGPRGMR